MGDHADRRTWEPRDWALMVLYEADSRRLDPPDQVVESGTLIDMLDDVGMRTVDALHADPGGRSARLVAGVWEHRRDLDQRIESVSEGWSVRRMAPVDRTILRLALYELVYEKTPTAVVLDEAVELAKRYSTRRSGAFVNGILAALARQVRQD